MQKYYRFRARLQSVSLQYSVSKAQPHLYVIQLHKVYLFLIFVFNVLVGRGLKIIPLADKELVI